jgi:hypothetical protein
MERAVGSSPSYTVHAIVSKSTVTIRYLSSMSRSAWPFVSRSLTQPLSSPLSSLVFSSSLCASTLGPLPPITRNPTPQPGAPVGRKQLLSLPLPCSRAGNNHLLLPDIRSLSRPPLNCSHYTTSLPPLSTPATLLPCSKTPVSRTRSPSADRHLPAISDSLKPFPRLLETFPNNFTTQTKNLLPKGHPVHFAPAH